MSNEFEVRKGEGEARLVALDYSYRKAPRGPLVLMALSRITYSTYAFATNALEGENISEK